MQLTQLGKELQAALLEAKEARKEARKAVEEAGAGADVGPHLYAALDNLCNVNMKLHAVLGILVDALTN